MKIMRKVREHGVGRGRFFFLRAYDVLHIYRSQPGDRSCRLIASIEPSGGRGQVRLESYQRHPMQVGSGWEALQLLRVMRRYG
jgi:hypothetical protein